MYDAIHWTLAVGAVEAPRVPCAQLLLVDSRDLRQWHAERVRGDRETPERVAQLAHDGITVEHTALHHMLSHVTEYLTGFLGESRRGVEQTLVVAQPRIDRTDRSTLIRVEIGDVAHE